MEHRTSASEPHGCEACEEYRKLTRRQLLEGSGLAAAAMATAPAWLPRVALGAAQAGVRDTLVHVFLRGGADGLTLCVPYGDGELYNRRPTLGITPPGTLNGAIDLDGFFGLAPALQPLLQPYQAGKLALVHAAGSTDPSRSHFSAQQLMELGIPNQPPGSISTGWIARHLLSVAPTGNGLLRGLALTGILPRSLAGAPATVPTSDPDHFDMPGTSSTAASRRAALTSMYASEGPPLGPTALDTFATIDLLATIDFANYVPANGAAYPSSTFGTSLKSSAAMIKADIGIETIAIDYGGWDFHNQMGPITGGMATKMDDVARGLLAFYLDLLAQLGRVTLVVVSEFGRRAYENASGGTDHGHGNCMLVMGGHIAGGQVMRIWPGLALPNLDNGDLAITIDYRDILSEIVQQRLGDTNLAYVFPNYTPVFRGITV